MRWMSGSREIRGSRPDHVLARGQPTFRKDYEGRRVESVKLRVGHS